MAGGQTFGMGLVRLLTLMSLLTDMLTVSVCVLAVSNTQYMDFNNTSKQDNLTLQLMFLLRKNICFNQKPKKDRTHKDSLYAINKNKMDSGGCCVSGLTAGCRLKEKCL